MFVHTYGGNNGTIIFVKTPIHYRVLLHPIVKYLLLKRQLIDRLSLLLSEIENPRKVIFV